MKMRTLLLAMTASMLITAVPALAQGAGSGSSTDTSAVQTIRYVKFVWIGKEARPVRVVTVDLTTKKIIPSPTETPPSGTDPLADVTVTVHLPCGKASDQSCSGNVNVPVADSSPTGEDNLYQLAVRLREYHSSALNLPMNRLPNVPDTVKGKLPAQLPGKVQNPAATQQQNSRPQ
ncbi:hypothetical protein [Hyalangium gracile]|uniref:hypothetical protein n=1 Tax=Hyalangium gracile TaxID=394092 RepID=UPI001CCE0D2F|nr:hypothetical protein [Hyalangium gracile]